MLRAGTRADARIKSPFTTLRPAPPRALFAEPLQPARPLFAQLAHELRDQCLLSRQGENRQTRRQRLVVGSEGELLLRYKQEHWWCSSKTALEWPSRARISRYRELQFVNT